MSDREGEDLTSSLTSYLQGYSTYSRINEPRRGKRGTLTSASHNRRLLSSAVAVIAALVVGIPIGLTLLLHSNGNRSMAESVRGPATISDLHMFSSSTGWAWGGGSQILHTTIGVRQWTLVPPPVGDFNVIEVAWVDSQSARILASSGSTQTVGTYQLVGWSTNDGGMTWARGQPVTALDETVQDIYSPTNLDFVDRAHGWFFDTQNGTEGAPMFIFRTTDGGMHWSQVETTPATGTAAPGTLPVGCVENGMAFRNATTGWVAGDCAGAPFLDITRDGGATWSAEPFDCPAGCSLNPPQFTSPRDGSLVAAAGIPVLFTTSDGGRTWTQRADLPATSVDFIGANDGFALGLTGNNNPSAVVWITHDGGRSWRQAAAKASGSRVGPTSDIDQIDFLNASLGWATPVNISSGSSGAVPTGDTAPVTFWETTNAGATWSLITPRFSESHTAQTGVARGTLEAVGGAAPGTPRPINGSITLVDAEGRTFSTTAGTDGVFSIHVPAGVYTITGRSPLYDSGSANCYSVTPVTVTSGQTVQVLVECQLK